ncbi:MAG: NUDIX domain-containing protein, partial [Pyramidobacter sp.]|nr:NUDIX domain-containing protein [Pyramidobacter sp.]
MIDVAAAIIYDEQGRMLICRRMDAGDCAGLWEFPGGKREHGESMA